MTGPWLASRLFSTTLGYLSETRGDGVGTLLAGTSLLASCFYQFLTGEINWPILLKNKVTFLLARVAASHNSLITCNV